MGKDNKEYMRQWRKKNPHYYKDYFRKNKDKSLTSNELYKSSIPLDERCEDFDELWNTIYRDVLKYWNFVPINSVDELERYIN